MSTCGSGHENPDSHKFCSECGLPLGSSPHDADCATDADHPDVWVVYRPWYNQPIAIVPMLGTLIAVLVAAVLMSGGGRRARSPSTQAASKAIAVTDEAVHTIADTVQFDGGRSVTLHGFEQGVTHPNPFAAPRWGLEFAVIDAEVCAGRRRSASYNELGFKAQMVDNRSFDSGFAIPAREPPLDVGEIPRGGGCRRGWVTIEVPAGQQPDSIVLDYPGWDPARWRIP